MGAGFARTPHPQAHIQTLTHIPTLTVAQQPEILQQLSQRQRQVQHSKWQFCCQIRKHTEQQQNEIHADKHFEFSRTARSWFSLPRSPGFSPVWFGQHSTEEEEKEEEEEVCLRKKGKITANSRHQPGSCQM